MPDIIALTDLMEFIEKLRNLSIEGYDEYEMDQTVETEQSKFDNYIQALADVIWLNSCNTN